MTGNTTTVMIGLGFVSLALPLGLLVLFRVNGNIERAHPFDLGPALPQRAATAEIPSQRPAASEDTAEPSSAATAPAG